MEVSRFVIIVVVFFYDFCFRDFFFGNCRLLFDGNSICERVYSTHSSMYRCRRFFWFFSSLLPFLLGFIRIVRVYLCVWINSLRTKKCKNKYQSNLEILPNFIIRKLFYLFVFVCTFRAEGFRFFLFYSRSLLLSTHCYCHSSPLFLLLLFFRFNFHYFMGWPRVTFIFFCYFAGAREMKNKHKMKKIKDEFLTYTPKQKRK